MAKYFLTHKAVEDLSDIWHYTYEAWSENQADTYYQMMVNAFQEIAINPETGRCYEELSDDIWGFGIGRHIIFYRSSRSKEIEIIRILHSSMDIKNRILE